MHRALFAILLVASTSAALAAEERPVLVWHTYFMMSPEAEALEQVIAAFEAEHPGVRVLAKPQDTGHLMAAFREKVVLGQGPDLIIESHEFGRTWLDEKVVQTLDPGEVPGGVGDFLAPALAAFTREGQLFGLPLSFATDILLYNRALVASPPEDTDALIALAKAHSDAASDRYGLAYTADDLRSHAAWAHGFGARVYGAEGGSPTDDENFLASLRFARRLVEEANVLTARFGDAEWSFSRGEVPMMVGRPNFLEPWREVQVGAARLPIVSETGLPARPLAFVEGVMLARGAARESDALAFAAFFAGGPGTAIRLAAGPKAVAFALAWDDPRLGQDPIFSVLREQLMFSEPMPSRGGAAGVDKAQAALTAALAGEDPQAAAAQVGGINLWGRPLVLLLVALMGLSVAGAWARRGIRAAREPGAERVGRRRWPTLVVLFVFLGLVFLVHPPFAVASLASLALFLLWMVAVVAGAQLLAKVGARLPGAAALGVLVAAWLTAGLLAAFAYQPFYDAHLRMVSLFLGPLGLGYVRPTFHAELLSHVVLGLPVALLVVLGARRGIPVADRAGQEGGSAFDRLRKVVLPRLGPTLVPALMLGAMWSLTVHHVLRVARGEEPMILLGPNSVQLLVGDYQPFVGGYGLLVFALLVGYALSFRRPKAARPIEGVSAS